MHQHGVMKHCWCPLIIGGNKGGVVLFRGKDRVSCIGPKQFIFFFGIGRLVLITLIRLRAGGSPTCPTIRTRCSSTTTKTLTPTAHDERTHPGSTLVVEALPRLGREAVVEGGVVHAVCWKPGRFPLGMYMYVYRIWYGNYVRQRLD